jgi:hypothetical protein
VLLLDPVPVAVLGVLVLTAVWEPRTPGTPGTPGTWGAWRRTRPRGDAK